MTPSQRVTSNGLIRTSIRLGQKLAYSERYLYEIRINKLAHRISQITRPYQMLCVVKIDNRSSRLESLRTNSTKRLNLLEGESSAAAQALCASVGL